MSFDFDRKNLENCADSTTVGVVSSLLLLVLRNSIKNFCYLHRRKFQYKVGIFITNVFIIKIKIEKWLDFTISITTD